MACGRGAGGTVVERIDLGRPGSRSTARAPWSSRRATVRRCCAPGTLLVENDNNGSDFPVGRQLGSLTRLHAPDAGTYYVGVAHAFDLTYDGGGDDEPGAYALTLAIADPGLLFADGFEGGLECWGAAAP